MQQGGYGSGRGGQAANFPGSNFPCGNTSVNAAFVGPGAAFPFSADASLFGGGGAFGTGGPLAGGPGFMGFSQVGADPMGNVAGAGFPSGGGQTGVMGPLGMVGQSGLPYAGSGMGQVPDVGGRGGSGGGGGGGGGPGGGGSRGGMPGGPGGGGPGGCGGFGRGAGGGGRGGGGKGAPGGGRGGMDGGRGGGRGPGMGGGPGGGGRGPKGDRKGGMGGPGGGGRGPGGKGGGGRGGGGGGRGGGPPQPLMGLGGIPGASPLAGLGSLGGLGGKTGMPGPPPTMNGPPREGGQKGGGKRGGGKDFAFKGGPPPFGKGFKGFPPFGWGKGKGKGQAMLRVDPNLKVWIGNLSEETKWKELQTHLNQAGKTKWVEVFTGKGACTGAAVFTEAEEVQKAVEMLNGSELDGNTIVVDVWVAQAKPREGEEAKDGETLGSAVEATS